MARAKDRILGVATFDTHFDEPGAINWENVQAAIGIKLDDKMKEEITNCAIEFSAAFALQKQGAKRRTLEALRDQIAGLADEVIALEQRVSGFVHPDDRTEESEDVSNAFTTLSLAYSQEESLRSTLNEMSIAGKKILGILENDPALSLEKTAVEPLTAGYSAFIAEVLKGAKAKPARGNHAWSENVAFEFRRWGINIGPQSDTFLNFCHALFGEGLTGSRRKTAFANMRNSISRKHPHFSKFQRKK